MQVARTVQEFRDLRAGLPGPVGLVPTMGALHWGHRSLMRRAGQECAAFVVSIFVNPTQFGPGEDYTQYPRDEETDLAACEAEGAALVLLPPVEELYPNGATTTVSTGHLSTVLEGAARPGHFDGVATVVTKLFNIVQPDRAYFGQKDAQQLMVIRRMARDLLLPVEIVGCPTVREEAGLALSSRNAYLTEDERKQALALSRALRLAEKAWLGGLRDADQLREQVRAEVAAEPLAQIEYVSLADMDTLRECEGRIAHDALLSLAVRFGKARLIDNTMLRNNVPIR